MAKYKLVLVDENRNEKDEYLPEVKKVILDEEINVDVPKKKRAKRVKKCMLPDCPVKADTRGLCGTHYAYLSKLYNLGDIKVEAMLIEKKLILPKLGVSALKGIKKPGNRRDQLFNAMRLVGLPVPTTWDL